MKLREVLWPDQRAFVSAMDRVLTFAVTVPGCNIAPSFFAQAVGRLYSERSPLMLLFLVVDDFDMIHGHCLGMVENQYGRLLGWVYQAQIDRDVPLAESRRLIREGKAMLEAWARRNHCVALAMATQRNVPAMARRFGFHQTHTLLESPSMADLEG